MKHGKKYVEGAKLIDRSKLYDTAEALDICVKTGTAKFDETVELHVKLGVDGRHADQQVRGAIVLPTALARACGCWPSASPRRKRSQGRRRRLCGRRGNGPEDPGRELDGLRRAHHHPRHDGPGGPSGPSAGPRGLMPNPKAGTVTPDIGKAVTDAKPVRSSTAWTRPTSSTAPSARFPLAWRSSRRTSTP